MADFGSVERVSAYGSLAAATFRQYSTYRVATAAGVFTNSVFGLIRVSILLAALEASGQEIGGYTALQAATYVWLGQALLAPIEAFGTRTIGERVRTGEIAVDLLRPAPLLGVHLAQKMGRAGFLLLGRGLPPLAVGALVTGLALPESPWSYVLGIIAVALAILVSFLADAIVNLTAFWLVEMRGFQTLYMVVMNLLSGFLIPITWFPGWLEALARATPFPSMVQTPIDTLSGRIAPADALALIGLQILWAAVLAVLAQAMVRAGTRSLEVQGG